MLRAVRAVRLASVRQIHRLACRTMCMAFSCRGGLTAIRVSATVRPQVDSLGGRVQLFAFVGFRQSEQVVSGSRVPAACGVRVGGRQCAEFVLQTLESRHTVCVFPVPFRAIDIEHDKSGSGQTDAPSFRMGVALKFEIPLVIPLVCVLPSDCWGFCSFSDWNGRVAELTVHFGCGLE